jgi:hypothetical protein
MDDSRGEMQIDLLSQRVASLDTRLDMIETMLRQIVARAPADLASPAGSGEAPRNTNSSARGSFPRGQMSKVKNQRTGRGNTQQEDQRRSGGAQENETESESAEEQEEGESNESGGEEPQDSDSDGSENSE